MELNSYILGLRTHVLQNWLDVMPCQATLLVDFGEAELTVILDALHTVLQPLHHHYIINIIITIISPIQYSTLDITFSVVFMAVNTPLF